METHCSTHQLKKFRQAVYANFSFRRDASMELVDAIASNPYPNHVVSLSLVECYRRNYCSITRSLNEFYPSKSLQCKTKINGDVSQLLSAFCPRPTSRNYYLFAVDCTSAPRIHAQTLEDRGFVHQSTPISGRQPITIGHEYSIAACLPEKKSSDAPPWLWPLACHRVTTEENGPLTGMKQIYDILIANSQFKNKLCVTVADSAYSNADCIKAGMMLQNQVHISRLKNNRVLCHGIAKPTPKNKKGRPKRYGDKFILKEAPSWGTADEEMKIDGQTKKGIKTKVHLACWNNIKMRGSRNADMSTVNMRVVRVAIYKSDGELLFKRPLWILACGERRAELSLQEIYEAYRQRFDIEHFFRFGKNVLLMDKLQTPEVKHEEAWWQMVLLSYAQLYLAREVAQRWPKPWEKYSPEYKSDNQEKTPSQVQRDFGRIIRAIGTPAKPPKPRKKSVGRAKGALQRKREKRPVINKSKKIPLKDAA